MTDRDTLEATASAIQSVIDAGDTLVERVAKAIHSEEAIFSTWETITQCTRASYMDSARAALAAIAESGFVIVPKEPTLPMLVSARDWSAKEYGKPIGNAAAIGCWYAMLSAARSETAT